MISANRLLNIVLTFNGHWKPIVILVFVYICLFVFYARKDFAVDGYLKEQEYPSYTKNFELLNTVHVCVQYLYT